MSASSLLDQWHKLVEFAKQPDVMTVSADVSAWSTSQHRLFWDVLHRCLGGTSGLAPSCWLDCLKDTAFLVGRGREQKLVLIQDGTYQGFTVFADSLAHDALWRTVVAKLNKEGIVLPSSLTLVHMDDTVVSLIMPPIENESLEEKAGHIVKVRRLLTDKMMTMFGLQIDGSLQTVPLWLRSCSHNYIEHSPDKTPKLINAENVVGAHSILGNIRNLVPLSSRP
eukprot:6466130-Amphidinium_carterae.2